MTIFILTAEFVSIVDNEQVLSAKDIEWSEQNLALIPDEKEQSDQPEYVASIKDAKENLEPPRKKVARTNKVNTIMRLLVQVNCFLVPETQRIFF